MVGKVCARVYTTDKMKLMTAERVMDGQGGFRPERECNGEIFAVRQVVEKTSKETEWCTCHLWI